MRQHRRRAGEELQPTGVASQPALHDEIVLVLTHPRPSHIPNALRQPACDGKKRCEAAKKELDRATNVNVGCSDELEQLSSSKLRLRALAAAMRVRAAQDLVQRLRLGV